MRGPFQQGAVQVGKDSPTLTSSDEKTMQSAVLITVVVVVVAIH